MDSDHPVSTMNDETGFGRIVYCKARKMIIYDMVVFNLVAATAPPDPGGVCLPCRTQRSNLEKGDFRLLLVREVWWNYQQWLSLQR